MNQVKRHVKRTTVAVVGVIVLTVGVITIPYPGPGWLIVFAGLGILATEFAWARRILDYARSKYDAWVLWVKKQHIAVRGSVLVATCLVVVVTIYLLNGYGMINELLDLNMPWLRSPFLA